ncbi:MAG: hypothetical protein JSV19_02780 [Phycisphaerales bacterium]|nr:MAG: hypothetical protein JSV19_02780 [Phycisphaerales bacterium]
MPAARGATQPGLSAAHVWMISFAVLWLVVTGLLVWVYTDQETVKKDNRELARENRRLISRAEESLPYYARARDGGPTVVGLIEQARADTAEIATGSAEDDPATVRASARDVMRRIIDEALVLDQGAFEGASLLGGIQALYDQFTSLHERWQESRSEVDKLAERVKTLAEAGAAQRDEFAARSEDIARQLEDINSRWEALQQAHQEQIAEFQRQYDDFRTKSSRGIQELRTERDGFQRDLTDIQHRYAELRAKLGELQITPVPLQTLREPDGMVLTAKPGEDVIYINLGRDAQLTLGLQFAVYSPDVGIPADGQSKARIEVVSVYDRSAACKIVEVSGKEMILEGDLIANPIYDRSRPLTFLVLGEFDLDHDKRIDPDGVGRIQALIEEWGGQTVDTVSARIDFVVAGSPPQEPRVIGEPTAELLERSKEIAERFERFTQELETAHSLSIPVLTQPVFLQFLGYGAVGAFPAI